jgi:hypothetical protein
MEDRGYTITFEDGQVLIRPKGSSLDSTRVLGNREGNLYRLKAQPTRALVHDSDDLCELWHRRMGHLHHRALPALREIVTGLPEFSVEQQGVCKGCALGKNAKATFPSSESRSKGILDLVHTDVLSGSSYFVTFIDDFSRRTWIFFMRTKSEVFSRFRSLRLSWRIRQARRSEF